LNKLEVQQEGALSEHLRSGVVKNIQTKGTKSGFEQVQSAKQRQQLSAHLHSAIIEKSAQGKVQKCEAKG
jgi:hypothetical protein